MNEPEVFHPRITRTIMQQLGEMENQMNAFHGYRSLWAQLVANREPCGVTPERLMEEQLNRLQVALGCAYTVAKLLGMKWIACEETEQYFKRERELT